MKARRWSSFAVALAAFAPIVGAAQVAGAQEPSPSPPASQAASVSAELTVMHATNDGAGIDPKIGKMPELGKPPFSAYNSYKLLDRVRVNLAKGAPSSHTLPNQSALNVVLKEVVEQKKKGDPKRYVVTASIKKAGGNTLLPLLEVNAKSGETFFVAGQSYKGGVLVIGIKVD